MYQGPVTVEQLLKDVDLMGSSGKAIEAAAFPFPGRNGVEHFTLSPLAFAQAYHSGGDSDAAKTYLEEQLSAREGALKELYFLGSLEQAQGHWDAAAAAYAKVLERSPEHPSIRVPLAVALWQSGRRAEAKTHFEAAEAHAANKPSIWADLGRGHLQLELPEEAIGYFEKSGHRNLAAKAMLLAGRSQDGIAMYEALLEENRKAHQVKNDLAWSLATHSDAAVRDAKRALDLATQLAELSGYRDLHVLDTLAAAEANAGNLDQAIKQVTTARSLARAVGLTKLASEMTERLKTYQSGRPWRR